MFFVFFTGASKAKESGSSGSAQSKAIFGGDEETASVSAGDGGVARNSQVSKRNRRVDSQVAISAFGAWNCARIQAGFAVSKRGGGGAATGGGGLLGRPLWRYESVCHSCQESDYYAERHAIGPAHSRREGLVETWPTAVYLRAERVLFDFFIYNAFFPTHILRQ